MLGLNDLLNSTESPGTSDELKLASKSPPLLVDLMLMPKPTTHRITKLLRLRVHPTLLKPNKLVDIALRRKLASRRVSTPQSDHSSLKLHLKLLEAGLRIRLILCPLMYELYRQLTPHNARKNSLVSVEYSEYRKTLVGLDILRVLKSHRGHHLGYTDMPTPKSSSELRSDGLTTPEGATEEHPYLLYLGKCQSKRVRLIDSNLVNISRVSNKVMKSFNEQSEQIPDLGSNTIVTTFNHLDTAVSSLFDIQNYSIVRVTRLASSSNDGSVLMKLETAKPGDLSLVDDREFMDDMLASLGRKGQSPNNIFIKKVVARPRYKSDMKIYIIPSVQDTSLYVDERILERDLINGVIDMDCLPQRSVFTTFPVENVLDRVQKLLDESKSLGMDCEPAENQILGEVPIPLRATRPSLVNGSGHGNGHGIGLGSEPHDGGYSSGSVSSSSLGGSISSSSMSGSDSVRSSVSGSDSSAPLVMSLVSSDSVVSTPAYNDILSIPNKKNGGELKFDTDYSA